MSLLAADALLEARDLQFRWPRASAPCLDIAHFAIAPGEAMFLHGPSDSGKSTLLSLMAGALLALEGALVTALGVLLGAALAAVGIALLGPWLQARHGLALSLHAPTSQEWLLAGAVLLAGWLASLLPGIRAYRLSLADGLSPRL